MSEEFVIKQSFEFAKPNYCIKFHGKTESGFADMSNVVGSLDFNGPTLVFEGNAEESAKVFIEWIATMFEGRLKEEYQRGYEDCLTDEGMR